MSSDLDVVAQDLWDVVGVLDIPLFLVELDGLTITEATPSFLHDIGIPASKVLHRPAYEILAPEDQRSCRLALRALGDGLLDFYSSRRRIDLDDHTSLTATFWNRSIQFGDCRFSLGQLSISGRRNDSPLVEYLGYSPPEVAAGTTDAHGIITSISTSALEVVGQPAEALIGRPLLSRVEQKRLLQQINELKEGSLTVSLPIHLSDLAPQRPSVRCIVTCLAESTSRFFLLLSEPDPASAPRVDRVAQLEYRLRRIASEVQASGIFDSLDTLPDAQRFPQLNSLNTRQWQVLSRLLRGERVPAIAEALFVSPSTIRNNLSEIFRIFDVHSQSELVSLLRH
jgi:DNA-binding CsgD family transcriptional regulator/PAS domain-containing protein